EKECSNRRLKSILIKTINYRGKYRSASGWPLRSVEGRADVASAGADQLASRCLLDGMRQPTDAAAQREQGKRRIFWKREPLHHSQHGEIEIGTLSGFILDLCGHLPEQFRRIERREEGGRARIAIGVEGMAESRDRHARSEMTADDLVGLAAHRLIHQGANTNGGV